MQNLEILYIRLRIFYLHLLLYILNFSYLLQLLINLILLDFLLMALIQALESKKIAGAGLDVFNQEPLPKEHAFRGLENVLATSHIGGRTRENFIARYSDCFDNVLSWLNGSPLRVIKSN